MKSSSVRFSKANVKRALNLINTIARKLLKIQQLEFQLVLQPNSQPIMLK